MGLMMEREAETGPEFDLVTRSIVNLRKLFNGRASSNYNQFFGFSLKG